MTRSRLSVLLLFLAPLVAGCSSDGGAEPDEQVANEANKAAYDQIVELEGGVELDAEGNIVLVELSSEQIGNDDLDVLGQIPTLSELNLAGSGVDDKGLEKLSSLSNLKVLEIEECKVTRRGVAKLQKSLSGCRINSSFEFEEQEEDVE